jgi:division protein CdvB (Snf7/Vps24/ESCRT-III family)
MSKPESIEQLGKVVEQIADSMTTVATNIAMLGVQGDADVQMRIITQENNKVLNRIRQLYNLPVGPET